MSCADSTPRSATTGQEANGTERAVKSPVGIPSGYQPALDGVRAVAVAMVVIYHLGNAHGLFVLRGGWLGVDVFFVLSGYLITALLLAEQERHGRISLRDFYLRRILRLAPLSIALVVCLVITPLGLHHWLPASVPLSGAVSIVFYYSNWWSIIHPSGLGSLGHVWSLSVEEQFYFVWPWIVVGAIHAARHRSRRFLLVVAGVGAIAMGIARHLVWTNNLHHATTGTDKMNAWHSFYRSSLLRPDGLIWGCLLAVLLHGIVVTGWHRRVAAVAGVAGLAVATAITLQAHTRVWTPWIAFIPAWGLSVFNISVALVIGMLVLAPRSPFARVLSLRPLTWIGRRAYGIYLLHFPIIFGVKARIHLSPVVFELASITLTLVAAGASYRWLESPFLRYKERFSPRRTTLMRSRGGPSPL